MPSLAGGSKQRASTKLYQVIFSQVFGSPGEGARLKDMGDAGSQKGSSNVAR